MKSFEMSELTRIAVGLLLGVLDNKCKFEASDAEAIVLSEYTEYMYAIARKRR